MWIALILTGLFQTGGTPATVDQLDAMAKARNVEGLQAAVKVPAGETDPFPVLKTNGAYEAGKLGWRAYSLKAPDGTAYAVIGTELTSEDIGEILLKRDQDKWLYIPETNPLGIRVLKHHFDLSFEIPAKRANIVDRMEFRSKGTDSFLFRMSPAYRVQTIFGDDGRAVAFRQASGVVALERPAKPEATYTIRYTAVVDHPLYAGSITDKEATLVNDYWYPMVARQPSRYDIRITPPAGWSAVAQGNRIATTDGTVQYKMDLPVVYFSVISAPFQTVQSHIGKKDYQVWSPRLTQDEMRMHIQLMAPIVEFYESTFGIWPIDRFGAVDSPQYGGGALEAYSFATYGGGLPQEDAHEPAHTLWGGVINNTYLKSFWNESFAVFTDGLYHREVPIGNRDERRLAFVSDSSVDPSFDRAPLVASGCFTGPVAGALGYGKGAKVLQMLEQLVGVQQMTASMKKWLAVHPKGEPGEWEDFEKIITPMAPGKDVKGFFDDWFRRPGYANFGAKVTWGRGMLTVQLNWVGPKFRMPLTILIRDKAGRDTYKTVWLDGKNDTIRLAQMDRPALVSLDPWRQAVRKRPETDVPVTIENTLGKLQRVVDPKHSDWFANMEGTPQVAGPGVTPEGKFLVGSPETWPLMADLVKKAGFEVKGNTLSYKGTKIDLNHGAAVAILTLDNGKKCAIGLGKTEKSIDPGQARTAVVDNLGRFLRGSTDPLTTGSLVFRP